MRDLIVDGWQWLDLAPWQLGAAVVATLVAGSISGLTGFGFGLVIVPIMLMIFPPATVVVLTGALAISSSLPILIGDRSHIRPKIVSPLLLPAFLGSLTGVRILTSVDAKWIKLGAGVLVVLFAILVARGFVIPGIRSRYAPLVAGYTSGLLGTSTGMSGPPVVLFLTSRTPEPRSFRASITAYFAVTNTVSLALVIRTGSVGATELGIAIVLLPFAILGRMLGQHLHHRVNQERFRQITLLLLIVTGTTAVISAVLAIR